MEHVSTEVRQQSGKRCVVAQVGSPFFAKLARITHPRIEAYAQRVGADFHVIRGEPHHHRIISYHKTEQIASLLMHYDEALYIDTDTLVLADTPNLFEMAGPSVFLGKDEHPFCDRRDVMRQGFSMILGPKRGFQAYCEWKKNPFYYNMGVFRVSWETLFLLSKPAYEHLPMYEQTWMNCLLHLWKIPHMSFSRPEINLMDSEMERFRVEERPGMLRHYAGLTMKFPDEEAMLSFVEHEDRMWKSKGL